MTGAEGSRPTEKEMRETNARVQKALAGVFAKINMADAQLKSLDNEWGDYLRADPCPYDFVIDVDLDTGAHTIYAQVIKAPSPTFSVIVGNVLHNLRSGLDHLAWELVVRAGAKPGRHTHFPICDSEQAWLNEVVYRRREKDRKSPLTGIKPQSAIWRFIEAVQPFKGAVYSEAMSSLRMLSNADKHRQLLVRGIFPDPDHFAALLRWAPGAVLREQRIFLGLDRPMKHGDKVAYLNFDPSKTDPKLRVEGQVALFVGFSDRDWKGSRPELGDLVQAIRQYVEYAGALYADPPHFEDPARLRALMTAEFSRDL